MRRAALFLSRFVIALWVILVSALLFLLVFESPSLPNTPFASVNLYVGDRAVVRLPNRIFTCTETEVQFQCKTSLQNQPLDLTWTKGSDYKYNLSNCQARYGGRSVECKQTGADYIRGLLYHYAITDGLTLNPQQLQALQQQYWGTHALAQLGELRLIRIVAGLSIAAGISAAFFAWLHPGRFTKAFASFVCGVGVYHLAWHWLGRIPYDTVTSYGLTPDTWRLLIAILSIVAGIGTSLATGVLLWLRSDRVTKFFTSLVSSVGIFNLCWLALTWGLSTVLANPVDGTVLMQLTAAVSFVIAMVAAVLLWVRTAQSFKAFLSLSNGFGASALAFMLFLFSLLWLGYAD